MSKTKIFINTEDIKNPKVEITTEDKMKITKDEYLAYENVRVSGVYNMFDSRAIALSGLHKEKYIEIMKRYDELTKQFS